MIFKSLPSVPVFPQILGQELVKPKDKLSIKSTLEDMVKLQGRILAIA